MNNFTYSKNGLSLTESFEGLRLTAYRDVKGVLTIGYGHTGTNVHPGMVISQSTAEALLLADVKHAAETVNRLVALPGFTQDEFDALVDFTFNVGVGAFAGSSLLKDLNAGELTQAAHDFEAWDKCAGAVVSGLLRRRVAEEHEFEKVA